MANPVSNNNQNQGNLSLIKFLQSQNVYSREIDGIIDEDGDGKIDAPDKKTSAKEWEYFFKQAEQYSQTIFQIARIRRPKEAASLEALAYFYLSILESGKPEKSIGDAAYELSMMAWVPNLNSNIIEVLVAKLLSLLESGKPEASMEHVAYVLSEIAKDPKLDNKIKEDMAHRLLSLFGTVKAEEAVRRIARGLGQIARDPNVDSKIKEQIIHKFISFLEAGRSEIFIRYSANALSSIVGDTNVDIKIKEKIVRRFLSFLKSGRSEDAIKYSCWGLRAIVQNDGVDNIMKEYIVDELLSFLESGKPEASMNDSSETLYLITLDRKVDNKIKEAMAPRLLSLLKTGKPENAIKNITLALSVIAGDPNVDNIIKGGIVTELLSLFNSGRPAKAMANIAWALMLIDRKNHEEMKMKAKLAPKLIAILESAESDYSKYFSEVLVDVAGNPDVDIKLKEAMVPGLLSLLESGRPENAMEQIANALRKIAKNPNIDNKIKEQMAPRLLSLFESGKPENAIEHIAYALMNIAKSLNRNTGNEMTVKMVLLILAKLKDSNNTFILKAAIGSLRSIFECETVPMALKKNVSDDLLNILRTSEDNVTINNVASALSAIIAGQIPAEIKENIILTYIAVLEDPSSFAFMATDISNEAKNKIKEAFAYALMNAVQDTLLTQERRDYIALKLLAIIGRNRYGELERFISSILRNTIDSVSPNVAKEINILTETVNPPYDNWFKNKNALTIKIYFQERDKFGIWQDGYLNTKNGFKKTAVRNEDGSIKETIFTRTSEVGGKRTEVKIIVPEPPLHMRDFNADVFESMADPNIDWIVYSGHSGMGAELALSFKRAPKATGVILQNPKLIQSASCTSCQNYLGKAKNLYPNSQFIGTTEGADASDGCTIFGTTLEGIVGRKSWKDIKNDLDTKKYVFKGNYLLPHQPEQLAYLDSDGDGISDSMDPIFNIGANINVISIDTFDFRTTSAEPPAGKLNQVAQDVSVSFLWNDYLKYFKDIIRYPEGGEFRNKGWFRHREDKTDFLRISESMNSEEMMFDVEINTGYSHCSIMTLKIMMIYELNKYFSENYEVVNGKVEHKTAHTTMTAEEKLRGFMLSVEVLEKAYNVTGDDEGKRQIKELYGQFIQKYGFSNDLSFELALDALKADDGTSATPTSKRSLEQVKNLISQFPIASSL